MPPALAALHNQLTSTSTRTARHGCAIERVVSYSALNTAWRYAHWVEGMPEWTDPMCAQCRGERSLGVVRRTQQRRQPRR